MKKEDVGMVNTSLKSTETREKLSTNRNPKGMSRCLSAPDAIFLHQCLQNIRQYFTIFKFNQVWTLRGLSNGDLLFPSIQQL